MGAQQKKFGTPAMAKHLIFLALSCPFPLICGPSEHPPGASTNPDSRGFAGRVATATSEQPNSKESRAQGRQEVSVCGQDSS